ncbi:MAG: DUF1844 domain-containing protein [Chlorobiota bacterium]|jgi:predicted lipid carrier protein YhbT|nr:MAG: DUF1844 domain-containing protein [Chlorobiota bacterium]
MDSQHFSALIMMLSSQAMMTMGKLKNPVSDTIEKDLLASQFMIDMLESVQKRTKGNLSDEEQKYLDDTLRDLRLNFVVEKNKELSPTNLSIENETTDGIPDNFA